MRTILLFLFLFFKFVPSAYSEEWRDRLFKNSPRLEYLNKELLKRYSVHKLLNASPQNVSNPVLFRENLIYSLYETESEKTKFFILKELFEILSSLKYTEKEIEIISNSLEFLSGLSFPQAEINPQANFWINQKRRLLEEEIKKKKEEKLLYSQLLKDKFNISEEIKPEDVFKGIKTGFDKEITKIREEILEWDNRYYQERKEKYPQSLSYLNVPTNVPYVFFSFPIPAGIEREVHGLLYEQNKIDLEITKLENILAEEEILLRLEYIQKRREILEKIIEKTKEAQRLADLFEDRSYIEDSFLKSSLSLIALNKEEELLKNEILIYRDCSTLDKIKTDLPPIPDFNKLINYFEENSLFLKNMDKELRLLQKMASKYEYFSSLSAWRELFYENEKNNLLKMIFYKWLCLIMAYEEYSSQKEICNLTVQLHKLSLDSPLYTPFDRKIKEIEILRQELILLDKEIKIRLLCLDLKKIMKVPQIEDIGICKEEIPKQDMDDIENLYNRYFTAKEPRRKKIDIFKKLTNSELSLLAKGQGKFSYLCEDNPSGVNLFLPFRLEITYEPISSSLRGEIVNYVKEYYTLREKLEEEKTNREKFYHLKLLNMIKDRFAFLKDLFFEQETILKDLEKEISPDIKERLIQQKIKLLYLNNLILEKKQEYAFELVCTKTVPKIILNKYEENLLTEKLSSLFREKGLSIINEIKNKEQEGEIKNISYSLRYLEKTKESFEWLSSLVGWVINIFSLKSKIGIIPLDDLSELKLIENNIEKEIYQIKRRIANLRKEKILSERFKPIDMEELQKISLSLNNEEEIIKNDHYLKLWELQKSKFSSQNIDFFAYLYKQRENILKEKWKLFPKINLLYNRIVSCADNNTKICEENLKNAIRELKEGNIGIYGGYGLNSVLLEYINEQKKLLEAKTILNKHQIEIWSILNNIPRFNYLSLIPSDLKRLWEKFYTSLRTEPFVLREREKRRKEFVMKNYTQKIHALNYLRKEENKKEILEKRRKLFLDAQEKELKNIEYLDTLWEKNKKFRERIRNSVEESKIDIKNGIQPLKEKLIIREENEEIIELIFINYAKRFRKENDIKGYINDITALFTLLPVNDNQLEQLPQWWAKYISPLLPYPEKTRLEEIIDPRLLGMYFYYAELRKYLGVENIQSLSPYINQDKEFLFLDLLNIPPEKTEDYLVWESKKIRELDMLTLSCYSKQELEEKRKILLRNARGLFGYTYGSLKDKILQKEIIVWLINCGIEEKDFPKFIKIAETVLEEIKTFLSPLSYEDKLKLNEAVRLRWLVYNQNTSLLEEELNKLDESILLGNLLSWSEFFWESKINKKDIPLFFTFMKRLKEEKNFIDVYGKYEEVDTFRRNFYISSLSYWAEKWLNFYHNNPEKAESMLKTFLARFKLIYSLSPFQNIYGPLDLIKINLQKHENKKRLQEFIGKIGFFVDWTIHLSMDDTEVIMFFDNLYALLLNKELIESFYINQGIELKMEWENNIEKDEILGILSSWIQFFHFRGIKEKKEIMNSLKEICFIQEKSKIHQLNLNIDEIRYWWEKSKLMGWSLDFVEKIFSNIEQLNHLVDFVCNELLDELYTTPLSTWETPQMRENFIIKIKEKKNTFLPRTEIYNLAEKIMPVYNLNFSEVKDYYKEKIYIETAYSLFTGEEILPLKMFQLHSIMKEHGYSIKEMGNFIYLYSLVKRDEFLSKTNPSDLEIYGFLNYLFNQIPPYEKKFLLWKNKASFLVKCFYEEHSKYIDFSFLKSVINYSLLQMRPWQIELLVKKGALSKKSPDEEIKMVEAEEDLRRYLFRIFWNNLNETLPEELMEIFTNFFILKSPEVAKSGFKK
ncbi:MAG: hypothetical protein AB7E08_00175, partial [Candidatus Omnitrophota bacterium]